MQSTDAYVEELQTEITNEVNVIAMVLLVFAAIALFVSVLVIANTFTILFAQRSRDFALLRCVGATRRQVLRSIRVEALCLGLRRLVARPARRHRPRLRPGRPGSRADAAGHDGDPEPSALWYAVAFAVGLLVTLVAAWLPTRRVVRVSPLAALRPDDGVDVRTAAGRLRTGTGLALVAGGVLLLGASIAAHSVAVMIAGGAASLHRRAPAGADPRPRTDPGRRPGLRPPARPTGTARGGQRGPQPAAYGHHDRVPAGRRHPDDRGADRAGQRAERGRRRHGRLAPGRRVLTSTGDPLPAHLLSDVRAVPAWRTPSPSRE